MKLNEIKTKEQLDEISKMAGSVIGGHAALAALSGAATAIGGVAGGAVGGVAGAMVGATLARGAVAVAGAKVGKAMAKGSLDDAEKLKNTNKKEEGQRKKTVDKITAKLKNSTDKEAQNKMKAEIKKVNAYYAKRKATRNKTIAKIKK